MSTSSPLSEPAAAEILDLNAVAEIADETTPGYSETTGIERSSPTRVHSDGRESVLSQEMALENVAAEEIQGLISESVADPLLHGSEDLTFTLSDITNGYTENSQLVEDIGTEILVEQEIAVEHADVVKEDASQLLTEPVVAQDLNTVEEQCTTLPQASQEKACDRDEACLGETDRDGVLGSIDQNGVEIMEVELSDPGKIDDDSFHEVSVAEASQETSAAVLDVHRSEDITAGNIKNVEIEENPNLKTTIPDSAEEIKDVFSDPGYVDESSFSVSDLVWGKVKSHPWWPGQIFDPSDASDLALKHQKKDHFLIGYFGDKTFAWCDDSMLRPFHGCFLQLANQSASETFVVAVDNALSEVSRRVELALSCHCTSQLLLNELKTQKVECAGIRKKSFVAIPGKTFTWHPDKLLHSIKVLAQYPCQVTDKLELTMAKAQALSFNRSRGKTLMFTPVYHGDEKVEAKISKGRRKGEKKYGSSENGDGFEFPGKGKKRKPEEFGGQEVKTPIMGKSFKIGECISRVASKLTKSPSNGQILRKSSSGKAVFDVSSHAPDETGRLSREMLSQLVLAARNPAKGHSFLSTIVPYFTEIRKLRDAAFKKRRGRKKKAETLEEPAEKIPKKRGRKKKSEPKQEEETEACAQDYMTDSYWTDRLVSSSAVQSAARKKAKLSQEALPLSKMEVAHHLRIDAVTSAKRNTAKTTATTTTPTTTTTFFGEKRPGEDCSPTALILSFSEPGAIPSETDLFRVFSRYGPLKEAETKVDAISKSAKVVFRRHADAEVAFSSTGQFGFFSPSLLSFRLKSPPSPTTSPQSNPNEDFADELKEAEEPGKETEKREEGAEKLNREEAIGDLER
ncbi:PWWP domain-containing protein 5-like [Wolffia australiana]